MYNGDYLSTNWRSRLSYAASNWNNYSDQRAALFFASYNSANVQLATWSTWPSYYPANAIAITFGADSRGNWWTDWSTLSYNVNCERIIVKAQIYTNINLESNNSYDATKKTKSLTHELGHVMCLGHPTSSTTQSIMQQGAPLSWSYYDRPQAHDKSDLSAFYP